MISFRQKGDYSKVTKYFDKLLYGLKISKLDRYGRQGVKALSEATPWDTGKTASSWSYEIVQKKDSVSVVFKNSNIVNGVPIALILQYGHGTRNGGYVEGRDYINPALRPVFDNMAKEAWEEVTKV